MPRPRSSEQAREYMRDYRKRQRESRAPEESPAPRKMSLHAALERIEELEEEVRHLKRRLAGSGTSGTPGTPTGGPLLKDLPAQDREFIERRMGKR